MASASAAQELYGCNVFKMISMKPQLNQHSYMRITNPQYAWQKMDEQNIYIQPIAQKPRHVPYPLQPPL